MGVSGSWPHPMTVNLTCTISRGPEYQAAILSHRINNRRYKNIGVCGRVHVNCTVAITEREFDNVEQKNYGNPDCGYAFICMEEGSFPFPSFMVIALL